MRVCRGSDGMGDCGVYAISDEGEEREEGGVVLVGVVI